MTSQKLLVLSLLAAIGGRSAFGQHCPPVVPPGAGALGADNTVAAMTEWDPDGAGPLGPRWVLGGTFGTAGDVLSPGIAAFDPATGQWSGFGAGASDVRALLALPNGQLLAAGDFAATLGPGAHIALWNGTVWQALGVGLDGPVAALARLPNGDLVVGGRFTTAGGTLCSNIARWDGTTWNNLGTGIPGPGSSENYMPVKALAVDPAGTLWVGGDFASAGGVPCANIARWNGAGWSPVGPGLTAAVASQTVVRGVTGLGVLPSGEVAAIGPFDTSGTSSLGFPLGGAARWNGVYWDRIGGGIGWLSSPPGSSMLPLGMSVAANGEIVVVGWRLFGTRRMLRWNLSQWEELPAATDQDAYPSCALFSGGELLVGGYFKQLGTPPVRIDHVARLAGANWQPLPSPSVGVSCDETRLGFGDYLGQPIATGRIGFVGNQPANGLIVRQGGTWQPFPGAPATVSGYVVTSLDNGELVVGGGYFDLGGTTVAGLVRYDGSTWSAFAGFSGSFFGSVRSLLRLRDGSLVVGGSFETVGGVLCNSIARWDGVAWSSFGTGVEGAVLTLLELPNGDLVAAGNFQVAGGVPCNRVARWNGSTWSPFGAGIGGFDGEVHHAVLDGSGALVVAGSFSPAQQVPGHVARWDGTNWSLLAGGVSAPVTGLAALPGGDILVAVANPYATTTSPGLLRTDGTTWTPFAVQQDGGQILSMHLRPDGELLLRGTFGGVGGVRSSKFASVLPSCPALATTVGTGCAGSGGQDTLTSVALPWLGSVARAEATGLPAEAWVVVALGVTPANVPLASLTPLALPGCDVRTSIDFYVLANLTGGSVPIDLPLPLTPALVGASLFEQVLSLGLTSGAPFEATSTNALELQLGLFGG